MIMKTIQSAARQQLIEDYNRYCDPSDETFREYVERSSQSDLNFFRWLFSEEFDDDFDMSLTDEHRKAFEDFLNSLD